MTIGNNREERERDTCLSVPQATKNEEERNSSNIEGWTNSKQNRNVMCFYRGTHSYEYMFIISMSFVIFMIRRIFEVHASSFYPFIFYIILMSLRRGMILRSIDVLRICLFPRLRQTSSFLSFFAPFK